MEAVGVESQKFLGAKAIRVKRPSPMVVMPARGADVDGARLCDHLRHPDVFSLLNDFPT